MGNYTNFSNPFKPGAGHEPPYLAGREDETGEFETLLGQDVILKNMILTGLRGVGKTVLLNRFKTIATSSGWWWVGTDLSESASISEESLALRLLTDLSVVTSNVVFKVDRTGSMGFINPEPIVEQKLNYHNLIKLYQLIPGLVSDKLKGILELTWECIKTSGPKGLIFAYDEAQTIFDQPNKQQYPIALLLDVFQSIQRKNIPFMLVLTGLPTLFPKLVDSRTFAERMFRVVFLKKLSKKESRDAIIKPIESGQSPVKFKDESVQIIISESGGYPYFIQFICKEIFDIFIQQNEMDQQLLVPMAEIIAKLDIDFFAGRWAKATDRQRELLAVIAKLKNCQEEFTVQEVTEEAKKYQIGSFSSSHVNQMLSSLVNAGLVYKNRHGKYSFAVPLLDRFISRQSLITPV
jgi:hypothetical protein